MKKLFLTLIFFSALLLSGCNRTDAQNTETTTAVAATPSLTVEGIEISYEDKWVYVNIPADYTDENIGEYFRETEWVVYVPHEDSMFCVYRGALYSKDMTKLYAVPYECEDEPSELSVDPDGNPAKVFTVPKTVTYIMPNAFFNRTETRPLKNIYIYGGVTRENVSELILWGGTFVTRLE